VPIPVHGEKKIPHPPFKSTQKKKFLEFWGMESHAKEDFFFLFFFCEFFQHNILSFMLKPKKSPQKNYFILRILDSFIITLY